MGQLIGSVERATGLPRVGFANDCQKQLHRCCVGSSNGAAINLQTTVVIQCAKRLLVSRHDLWHIKRFG